MTQNEIIRSPLRREQLVALAREASIEQHRTMPDMTINLIHFAALVAEAATKAERERCKTVLMAAHELSKQYHNYYHYIALQLDETAKVMK